MSFETIIGKDQQNHFLFLSKTNAECYGYHSIKQTVARPISVDVALRFDVYGGTNMGILPTLPMQCHRFMSIIAQNQNQLQRKISAKHKLIDFSISLWCNATVQ